MRERTFATRPDGTFFPATGFVSNRVRFIIIMLHFNIVIMISYTSSISSFSATRGTDGRFDEKYNRLRTGTVPRLFHVL